MLPNGFIGSKNDLKLINEINKLVKEDKTKRAIIAQSQNWPPKPHLEDQMK